MVVRIRLFAQLRERAGAEFLDAELPDGATVADALRELARAARRSASCSRGCRCGWPSTASSSSRDTALRAGDELALLPPVSGGAAPHVRVSDEPLDAGARSTDLVRRAGAGAVVTFEGTVRDVEFLDYEAYREMAEERIGGDRRRRASTRHGLEAAAAEHRVGRVALGEPAVVVAASAAHRDEAFAGAREIIDRIKAQAPIWKRELDGGEARWVAGERAAARERAADAPRRGRRARGWSTSAPSPSSERRARARARVRMSPRDGGRGRRRQRAQGRGARRRRASPASWRPSRPPTLIPLAHPISPSVDRRRGAASTSRRASSSSISEVAVVGADRRRDGGDGRRRASPR